MGALTMVLSLYVVVVVVVGIDRQVQALEIRVAGYWETNVGMLTDSMCWPLG